MYKESTLIGQKTSDLCIFEDDHHHLIAVIDNKPHIQ
jgi:hypothetical protein